MSTRMRTLGRIALGAVVLALGVCVLNCCIPFNFRYVQNVEAHHLRTSVREWQLRSMPESYARTSQIDTTYIWRTNLVVGNTSVWTLMRLDSSLFRNRGYLVATSNGEVFWVGRDGRAKALSAK